MSRRTLLMWPVAALATAASGCGSGRLFRRRCCEEEVFTAPSQEAPFAGPRMRLAVLVRATAIPPEFHFPAADFYRSVSVALQETGRFEVIDMPDPRDFPEVLLGAADCPPPAGPCPERFPPHAPVDGRLLIDIVEYRPYRPMQLHARVRIVDMQGHEIAGFDRTWYGPQDVEPVRRLHPRALRHPPPPAREEAALTTNSPQHLMDVAARETAGLLAASVPPPGVIEPVPMNQPEPMAPPMLDGPPAAAPGRAPSLPAPPEWPPPAGT